MSEPSTEDQNDNNNTSLSEEEEEDDTERQLAALLNSVDMHTVEDDSSTSSKTTKIRWAETVDVMFEDGRRDKESFNDIGNQTDPDDLESLYETAADLIDMLLHPQVKQKKVYLDETKMARVTDLDDEEDIQEFKITADYIDRQIDELTNDSTAPPLETGNPFTLLLQSKDEEIEKLKAELSNWQYNCKELERLGSTAVQELSVQLTHVQSEMIQLQQRAKHLEEENSDLRLQLSQLDQNSRQKSDQTIEELQRKIKMLEQINEQLTQAQPDDAVSNSIPPHQDSKGTGSLDYPKSPSSLEELKSWAAKAKLQNTKLTLALEEYLSDAEFQQVFHIKRAEFFAMPKWWQQLKRKKVFHL